MVHKYPPWYKEKMADFFPDKEHPVRIAVENGKGLKSVLKESLKETDLPKKRRVSIIKELDIVHLVY